jgi:cadmium resistance protein CadD (predicted permease)
VVTNVDAIAMLVTYFADPKVRARDVWIGQLAGGAVLIALSLAGSLLSLVVRSEFLGVLGAVPIVLGITKLIDRDDDEDAQPRKHGGALAVALATMASGGDNVGAYVPIFATRTHDELAVTVAVFVVMLVVWCWLCTALVRRPRVGPRVHRIATWVTPFVFMALGVLIFIESSAPARFRRFPPMRCRSSSCRAVVPRKPPRPRRHEGRDLGIDVANLKAQLPPYVESVGAGDATRAFSGYVLVAQHDQVLYSQAFDFADRVKQRIATADTSSGSFGQAVHAAAILRLEQDGSLGRRR